MSCNAGKHQHPAQYGKELIMKNFFWVISVLFFLIWIPPVLMIMMFLVLTDVPLINAFIYWTPLAVIGTLTMAYWYFRQDQKLQDAQEAMESEYFDYRP
jgi:hypothetical protein